MKTQKRIAAIHDISGLGKCSLTVALPVISAAGIECSVMPTAVLSTHTGGFTGFTFRDLTDDLLPFAEHWKSNGFRFDAIYTGYLGSTKQIVIVKEIFDMIADEDTLIISDPAMADYGRMYALFDMDFAKGMAGLCKKADIVVPNFTEAAFMLGEEYVAPPYDKAYVEGLIKRLSDMTGGDAVLTGVQFSDDGIGAASYSRADGEVKYAISDKLEGSYHGTGDVFASVLTAAVVSGRSLADAAALAVRFTRDCIARTLADPDLSRRYGVNFEGGLGGLASELAK